MHHLRALGAITLLALAPPIGAQAPRSPRAALGFEMGADRTLADWSQITRYLSELASASPAVVIDTLGATTNGQPFVLVTVSSPANIRRLGEIRAGQALLADPRRLSATDERRLIEQQPSVVLISCNIHATEIASSQMVLELAHRLATNDTLQRYLENTVVLLIPSMNPDGQRMITDWYRRGVGGRWEGGALPWLYHPYVGHDNNRDWYMVTQKETRLGTELLYRRWFPEIVYDVHQQGTDGMRLFVPPMVDPVNPNLDPVIVRGIGLIGAQMAFALEAAGKSGVGDGVTYDLWWHGGFRSTPTRHNMISLLTEAASVRIATPITLDSASLKGHARGLPVYERRVNFPNPWPGGTWRLRDIVEYELIAAETLVRLASQQRESFVRGFVNLARRQIELGRTSTPRAFLIPAGQRDPGATARLIEVLQLGGVEVHDGRDGSYHVRLDQPYRAHAKDLLEAQRFPKMEQYPGGPPERPYDVAGWTLPMQMGVTVRAADTLPAAGLPLLAFGATSMRRCPNDGSTIGAARYEVLDARDTESYRRVMQTLSQGGAVRVAASAVRATSAGGGATFPAGSFVIERRGRGANAARECASVTALPAGRTIARAPRVALYRPWTANMDEGWTRWLFEQFAVPHVNVTDSMIRAGRLRDQFDVVLVSDMSLREAREGMSASAVPPEYVGGLGDSGLSELRRFTEQGGTLILFDRASEIATTALGVGVTRITVPPRTDDDDDFVAGSSDGKRSLTLYAPGSILRVLVDPLHPVAAGMPDTAAVYFTNSTSFDVSRASSARVIARYPARVDDVLLSGYLQGGDAIAGRVAAVDAPVGRGRVIMFGFRPQYRAQSYGTFKMLFNALLQEVGGRR